MGICTPETTRSVLLGRSLHDVGYGERGGTPRVKRKAKGITAEPGLAFGTHWLRNVPPEQATALKSKLSKQVRDTGVRIVDF